MSFSFKTPSSSSSGLFPSGTSSTTNANPSLGFTFGNTTTTSSSSSTGAFGFGSSSSSLFGSPFGSTSSSSSTTIGFGPTPTSSSLFGSSSSSFSFGSSSGRGRAKKSSTPSRRNKRKKEESNTSWKGLTQKWHTLQLSGNGDNASKDNMSIADNNTSLAHEMITIVCKKEKNDLGVFMDHSEDRIFTMDRDILCTSSKVLKRILDSYTKKENGKVSDALSLQTTSDETTPTAASLESSSSTPIPTLDFLHVSSNGDSSTPQLEFLLPPNIVLFLLMTMSDIVLPSDMENNDFKILLKVAVRLECNSIIQNRIISATPCNAASYDIWQFIYNKQQELDPSIDYSTIYTSLCSEMLGVLTCIISYKIYQDWSEEFFFVILPYILKGTDELQAYTTIKLICEWIEHQTGFLVSQLNTGTENTDTPHQQSETSSTIVTDSTPTDPVSENNKTVEHSEEKVTKLRKYLYELVNLDSKEETTIFRIPTSFSTFFLKITDPEIVSDKLLFKFYKFLFTANE
ncbi:hypothetical protein C9374_006659 [Naegleria lovaniensis]|uniref:Uncharacterized protein n=1 Tax=Naegleria lovaniensis TaxID=51637 RepID=A0AA88KGW3_NAELO|nr:uncharacterized protein C9374_006659 [Naegleria lovaniensis]KAG2379542.1 hypothetical protein C9374_006659 [Naegleria lovaniensis]